MIEDLTFAVKKSKIEPWEINREGNYGALVLRFAGCSLRCFMCYSQSYAYLNKLDRSVGWARIQGGEPLLDDKRSEATAILAGEALKCMVHGNSPYVNPRVIIQTNGIWLGNASTERITKVVEILVNSLQSLNKGRIIIEISFKGSNAEMANAFALSRPSPYVDNVLSTQINGFNKLLRIINKHAWKLGIDRLAIYPVAAIGPQLSKPNFIPIWKSTSGEEFPLFHPETWSESFTGVVRKFKEILFDEKDVYVDFINKHSDKLPMESMEASKFQYGWISQLKHRPELREFVRKNLRILKDSRLNIFMKYIEDIPEAGEKLLRRVKELEYIFYEAEPKDHYPYL